MNEATAFAWLLRTVLGGGFLLLVCWLVVRRLRSPARQQRLGEWAVAAALVLGLAGLAPAWLLVPVPGWHALVSRPQPVAGTNSNPDSLASVGARLAAMPEEVVIIPDAPGEAIAPLSAHPPAEESASVPPGGWNGSLLGVLVLGYGLVGGLLLARWGLAHLIVWWQLRGRKTPTERVRRLFAERCRNSAWGLVVSRRARAPYSVGLWRPTVVLPVGLAERGSEAELRWVLAHELAHLERHDTRTCWLFGLGQVLFFALPWFWWLRRRVRLCQEYLADAAAARVAGERVDYAQFLLGCAGRPPASATGVSGSYSDLYRRIAMLLGSNADLERRCPRRWTLALGCGLTAQAVLVGGLGVRAYAEEKKKPEETPRKAAPAPAEQGQLPGVPLEDLFPGFGKGPNAEAFRDVEKRMELMRKRMDEMMRRFNGPGFPGFPEMRGLPGEARRGTGGDRGTQGVRLGVQIREPNQALVDQLDLPKDQGVVVEEVGPNSAAAKAGVKQHDIVLEVAGKPAPSKPEAFRKLIEGVKANTPVDVVVLRKGKKETLKGLTLPEVKVEAAPAPAPLPNLPRFPGLGRGFLPPNLGGGMTAITRTGDSFTARQQAGAVTLTVKGKVDQGKAQVSEVEIQANGQVNRYDSLEKVPAEHRDRVRKLTDMAAGNGARGAPAKEVF